MATRDRGGSAATGGGARRPAEHGPRHGGSTGRATVADVLLTQPRTARPDTSVAQARTLFGDDHLHALLLVDGARLLAVVERADLVDAPPPSPAWLVGSLVGRTVDPAADLGIVHRQMLRESRRRLAVVDPVGTLLGLLCLKRSGCGFCTDADVRARALERQASVG